MDTYEKKYKGALNWMREMYPGLHGATKEDAEHYFPELRESEDERIRKLLVWQVYRNIEDETNDLAGSVYDGIKGHDPDLEESIEDWKKCLNWLEKQKDHFRDDTKMVEKQDYSGLNDLERAIHRGFLSAGVENVPAAIIKETAKECKRIANENANAEWSEEDEVYLQDALWCVNQAAKVARGENDMGACWSAERWLKSLRPVKQEWSEEDKSFYDSIMCEVVKEGMQPTPEQANWLKSLPERFNLQPKQEWSEEDKEILEKLHRLLVICRGEKKFIQEADYNKMDNLLKSLRPQPHWKPSKEQQK